MTDVKSKLINQTIPKGFSTKIKEKQEIRDHIKTKTRKPRLTMSGAPLGLGVALVTFWENKIKSEMGVQNKKTISNVETQTKLN
jgi:hypothetical protein